MNIRKNSIFFTLTLALVIGSTAFGMESDLPDPELLVSSLESKLESGETLTPQEQQLLNNSLFYEALTKQKEALERAEGLLKKDGEMIEDALRRQIDTENAQYADQRIKYIKKMELLRTCILCGGATLIVLTLLYGGYRISKYLKNKHEKAKDLATVKVSAHITPYVQRK